MAVFIRLTQFWLLPTQAGLMHHCLLGKNGPISGAAGPLREAPCPCLLPVLFCWDTDVPIWHMTLHTAPELWFVWVNPFKMRESSYPNGNLQDQDTLLLPRNSGFSQYLSLVSMAWKLISCKSKNGARASPPTKKLTSMSRVVSFGPGPQEEVSTDLKLKKWT